MDIRSYKYLYKLLCKKELVLRRALDDAIKSKDMDSSMEIVMELSNLDSVKAALRGVEITLK